MTTSVLISSPPKMTCLVLSAVAMSCAVAAEPLPGQGCIVIADAAKRLSCYDQALNRTAILPAQQLPPPQPATEATTSPVAIAASSTKNPSPVTATWELESEEKRGTFKLVPHKLNYVLPVVHSSSPNLRPASPAAGHTVTDDQAVDATEAKFQFSFKTKAWENMFGDNGDLWFAYTQQSEWQAYNDKKSSPFRETNYEPEVFVALRTDANLLGWQWRGLNLGFVHQSNGREIPLSRSWNRVYAQFALERGNFTLLARPWYRLPESTVKDDNPDIRDYMGSGDLRLMYSNGGHVLSALGRYSTSGKHGGTQLEWAFPISKALKGYLQVTSGYGASLIDYNHSQTAIGVGFLLLPW